MRIIMFALFAELTLPFPIYLQPLLKSSKKTYQHCIFGTKFNNYGWMDGWDNLTPPMLEDNLTPGQFDT